MLRPETPLLATDCVVLDGAGRVLLIRRKNEPYRGALALPGGFVEIGESVEAADIFELEVQYLYNDGDFWHFMNPQTFEQHAVAKDAMGDTALWLKEEDLCQMMLYNGQPLSVTPPNFTELRIVETDPGLRGDTSGGGGKPATLETGAVVRVPLFVDNDELIKVDTRTGEYVSRVKE